MAKKANVTIAISGTYNGRALERARQDLEKTRIKAVAEMGGAGSGLVMFGSAAAELGGKLHNAGYKMEQVGTKATKYITVPIVAAAAACGKAAIDMDTALTGVRKTVDGTEQDYQNLKKAAKEFSETNAVSATQIMELQALGAQLGYNIEELDEFSRVVSGLDIATNMDAETAGTELAQFANITKMAHSATSNYASAIVGLGNNMATTESDISHMAMRLAAAGTQVGMSQADILGLAAALSSMGVEAEAGGSAVSTIMSQIDKDVAHGTETVQVWADAAGMSADAFADAWRKNPVDALAALLSGMEKATDEGGNMSLMLEDLGIESIRQTDIMKRMAGNSELVAKAVKLSNQEWKANTALTKEVANRNDSMAAKLQILKNKVTNVADEVGTPLVEALTDAIDAAEPLIQAVKGAAESFASLDKGTQQTIIKLVAAAAAFGPVTTGAGKLLQGTGNLVTGFGKLAQKAGALKSEWTLLKDATEAMNAGLLDANAASAVLSGGTEVLAGAMGTLHVAMAGLGIVAVVAGLAALAIEVKKDIDRSKELAEATYGLETAMGSARDAYESYAGGAEVASKSIAEIKSQTRDAIQAQGELAQSMSEQWAEYGTNAAIVDAYAQEIAELTSKYGAHDEKLKLTAEEQQRLRMAVDGYNEATGSSVHVTDALNGTLDTSVTSIMATAEAFKEQARAQAAMEMYKDLYKQQITDQMALNDATAKLNELKALEATEWDKSMQAVSPYASQINEAQREVEELTAAMSSNERTQEQLLGVMMGAGATFDSFDAALESSGVAMSDFGNLTDQQLADLKSGFDGSLASIVSTCSEKGIQIPQSLADAMERNKSAATDAASGLGADIDAGIAKGIEDNADVANGGAESVGEGLINVLRDIFGVHSPSTVTAEMGRDLDQGLANGITEGQDAPTTAATSLGDAVKGALGDLAEWFGSLGRDSGADMASGLGGNSDRAKSAGKSLYTSAQTGANPVAAALGAIGTSAGSKLAQLLGAQKDAAKRAGASLASSAQAGVNPSVSALGSQGTSAARSYANAIGGSSARSQGVSLGNTAKSGVSSVSASSAGRNFASSFASGMSGVNVWSAAYNIGRSALSAIKSALGIHSPSKAAREVGDYFGQGLVLGMEGTVADVRSEARRLSDAMGLDASRAWQGSGAHVTSYQQGRQEARTRSVTLNVTVNVNATTAQQAAVVGRALGDELYLEYARRERNAI